MNTRQSLEIERLRLLERYEEQPRGRLFAPLADCLRKLGELDEALAICEAGLERHPEYSSAHVILGKIQLERGDDAAARRAFERVLELDAQNLLAMRQLARLSEAAGDCSRALGLWTRLAALEPDGEGAREQVERLEALARSPGVEETAVDPPAETEAVAEVPAPIAEAEPEPEPDETGPPALHTSEIATITLAEIYAEQGFKSKALEIYRQVLGRHPEMETVAARVRALESDLAAANRRAGEQRPEDYEFEPDPPAAMEAPEVLVAELPDEEAPSEEARGSGAEQPRTAEQAERDRYAHFRSWLDRVRVDGD